jgi:hypothetical protein
VAVLPQQEARQAADNKEANHTYSSSSSSMQGGEL